MVTARPYDSYRNRKVTGFLLSLAFAGLSSVRDVWFGGLFQEVNPILVALTAFGLCSLVFLPIALISDPAGRPPIPLAREHPRACALADERGNCRDTQVRIHRSTGLDGSMIYNGPAHRAVPEPRC